MQLSYGSTNIGEQERSDTHHFYPRYYIKTTFRNDALFTKYFYD